MSGKKWLMIGCGGCLGLVLLLIIAGGILFWSVGSYIQEIGTIAEQLEEEHQALEQAFPFNPPEPPAEPEPGQEGEVQEQEQPQQQEQSQTAAEVFDEERFQQFLTVRENTVQKAREELQWFLDTFGLQENTEPDINWTDLIFKIMELPKDAFNIGLAQVEELKVQEMSVSEYKWYTKMTAAEVVSWRNLPDDNELKQWGEQYLQPMYRAVEIAEKIEEEQPSSNINLDIFEPQNYLATLQPYQDPEHPLRDVISQHKEEFVGDNFGVFIDAWAANDFDYDPKFNQ